MVSMIGQHWPPWCEEPYEMEEGVFRYHKPSYYKSPWYAGVRINGEYYQGQGSTKEIAYKNLLKWGKIQPPLQAPAL